jgi:hypothetical protein
VADDPTADVTIRNEATLEERTVAAGAVQFFTNPQSGWVVIDAAGRRRRSSPPPP